ncbi:uncharacterized protein TRIADDRAFT_58865 [Trichoplax adhaerens]|uniref:Extracellular Endonuclease subunit A domain-containing protein n=1 Tax=Trichoplax adhaerens TaxID=10228 RepID=B3S3W0_TRIAD|nr:hypothetical protein TRIADDRAFT_58865 [Trichoplax adhaerens]EDV22535.1 hypothetical protein TRIADDRAFT_58865 [Trichoplax adhaerens]|eukprot:XP_002115079.1 hypothetical protein TRIADDRAFT_58865 [Trichoplax adhaerens]
MFSEKAQFEEESKKQPDGKIKRSYLIAGIILIIVAFAIGLLIGIFTQRAANSHSDGQDSTITRTTSATTKAPNTVPPVTRRPTRSPVITSRPTTSKPTKPPIPGVCKGKVKPLLLVSLDGFRWNYFHRGYSPNISKFAAEGVRAEYMQSSFPTKTFPNHYTIVTGLYPAYHGIIGNSFYDPVFKDQFYIGAKNSSQSRWWGGEPIWVTARKHNLKSASYFWVGSESKIAGYQPNYWYTYSGRVPFMDRVDQFFKWMEMPDDERPSMVTMYFDQPDTAGHRYGPDSAEVNEQIKIVDDVMGAIFYGLKKRGMQDCVNIIITADHGMRKTCCNRILYFNKYINTTEVYVRNSGPFGGIQTKEGNVDEVVENLRCKNKHWKVFKKEDLPIRMHYYDNRRIPEIIVLPDEDWIVRQSYSPRYTFCHGANHGWNNLDPDMRTIFIAGGPAFKSGVIIKPFLNIEIYNLMATVLNIPPAKNNGTLGRLHHILKNPPPISKISTGQPGKVCRVPQDSAILAARQNCSECICSSCHPSLRANLTRSNEALKMTAEQEKHSEQHNLPWGVPKYENAMDTCTLYHKQYISGYSNIYHIPLFAGYFLSDKESTASPNKDTCYHRDIRLDIATQTSNCSNYVNSSYEKGHLMPKSDVSFDVVTQSNSNMLSNIVPLHAAFKTGPWNYLEMLINKWSKKYGGIFVISGAMIKADHETVMSDPSYWLNGEIGSVAIPTHLYKIVVKCQDSDQVACNGSASNHKPCGGKLEALSFILPHSKSASPQCHSAVSQIFEHVSSIADIEKLTGIDFFPELPAELQVQLEAQIPTELWSIF